LKYGFKQKFIAKLQRRHPDYCRERIKTIKKNNSKSGVIIISAKSSLDDKINGLNLGVDDYMTKPFQLSELNSRIKTEWEAEFKMDGKNIRQILTWKRTG